MVEIILLAQDIIEREKSWQYLNIDKQTIFERMDYDNTIKPTIEQHSRTDLKYQRYDAPIMNN